MKILATIAATIALILTAGCGGSSGGEDAGGTSHEGGTSDKAPKAEDTTEAPTKAEGKAKAPTKSKAEAGSEYIALLDTQVGVDFYAPQWDKGDLKSLGWDACAQMQDLDTVSEETLQKSSGAFMRDHNMNVDQAMGIYTIAMTTLCPKIGNQL